MRGSFYKLRSDEKPNRIEYCVSTSISKEVYIIVTDVDWYTKRPTMILEKNKKPYYPIGKSVTKIALDAFLFKLNIYKDYYANTDIQLYGEINSILTNLIFKIR